MNKEAVWEKVQDSVLVDMKHYLLTYYSDQLLAAYHKDIHVLVANYARRLPPHVWQSERDDLLSIAQIEFMEAVKAWDPLKSGELWPLAYSHLIGAMKDHLRYLTKADPSRLYDWVTNASALYQSVHDSSDFEVKIETGVQLKDAIDTLTDVEQKIVVNHYKADLTFTEIAVIVNLSESQVSRVYNKAITKIKKILTK